MSWRGNEKHLVANGHICHQFMSPEIGSRPSTFSKAFLQLFEQQEDGVPVPTMNSIVSALRFFFTHR